MSLFGAVWMADLGIDRPYQPRMGKNTDIAFFEIRIVEIFQDKKREQMDIDAQMPLVVIHPEKN
jgi:hypothetical protein